jgi:addiction module HigA family antidote
MKEYLDPIHPGKILLEDFLKPMGISINKLAREIDVPPGRISTIVNGKRSITADTALRLGVYFGVSPELWLNLQADYDLRVARRSTKLHITPLKLAA